LNLAIGNSFRSNASVIAIVAFAGENYDKIARFGDSLGRAGDSFARLLDDRCLDLP